MAAFTGGSLLIGTVGRPDLVEPRLTEQLARAQHASVHRLADELDDQVAVLPTHGFGSFCSSSQAEGDATTIGKERATNDALTVDVDTFVAQMLAGLDDVPAYYAHMGPVNAAGPAPVEESLRGCAQCPVHGVTPAGRRWRNGAKVARGSSSQRRRPRPRRHELVHPSGFEPKSSASEANILSIELWVRAPRPAGSAASRPVFGRGEKL